MNAGAFCECTSVFLRSGAFASAHTGAPQEHTTLPRGTQGCVLVHQAFWAASYLGPSRIEKFSAAFTSDFYKSARSYRVVRKDPTQSLLKMIKNGKIIDAKTICAALVYESKSIDTKRIK